MPNGEELYNAWIGNDDEADSFSDLPLTIRESWDEVAVYVEEQARNYYEPAD